MTHRLLVRGRIRTLDPARPEAHGILVEDGVVAALDSDPLDPDPLEDISICDLGADQWVQPGYRDEHVHLLAMAAANLSVDVSSARDLDEVVDLVARAAESGDAGGWVRAWGYDEGLMSDAAQLRAGDLDGATDRPVVVHHRTGHVAIVNTAALSLLGDGPTDGVLVERHDLLAGVPRLDSHELSASLGSVLDEMTVSGIVGCTDATHTNDLSALELLATVCSAGRPDITAMVGADHLRSLGSRAHGDRVGAVEVGHAKVMPPMVHDEALGVLVDRARCAGFPIAVHVMDIDTLAVTLVALADDSGPAGLDRIEHCALALPEQLDVIADQGLVVVTQPSFVVARAAKYRRSLSAVEQQWLWPLASLVGRGVEVRFSSDAPVVRADPMEWIDAAAGRTLGPGERITRVAAETRATGGVVVRVGTSVDSLVLGTSGAGAGRAHYERLGVALVR